MVERLLANWPVKLLSLVAAFILWIFVLGSQDPQTTQAISLPVVATNVPDGLEVIDITPRAVELRVRGRASALVDAEAGDVRMEADLRNATVGENEVALRVAGLPPNVTVIPGYPTTAIMHVDTIIERRKPVDYERRGDPAEGFVIDQISVEPAEVTVRGATSIVARVIRAVAIVDTSGLNTSMSFALELEARDIRDETVNGVTFDPPSVNVNIEVRQVNVRTVPVRPIIGTPPAGYTVTNVRPDPVVVTIAGDDGLADVAAVSTALVDISGLRGTKTYAVSLNVPSGMSVLGAASVSVTVTTAPLPSPAPAAPPTPSPPDNDEPDPEEETVPPVVNDEDDATTPDVNAEGNGNGASP